MDYFRTLSLLKYEGGSILILSQRIFVHQFPRRQLLMQVGVYFNTHLNSILSSAFSITSLRIMCLSRESCSMEYQPYSLWTPKFFEGQYTSQNGVCIDPYTKCITLAKFEFSVTAFWGSLRIKFCVWYSGRYSINKPAQPLESFTTFP